MSRLMLCVLMSCVTLCSCVPVQADNAEEKSVKFVEKLGGKVTRDQKLLGKPVIDVFQSWDDVTDARLKELAGLKSLTILNLGGTKVTDAGLKELTEIKSLTGLGLRFTAVTDTGMKQLAGFKKLSLGIGQKQLPDFCETR